MATPGVYAQSGTPDVTYPKITSPPRVLPSSKETQASLKRSFEKYLAADNGSPAVGKLFNPARDLAFEEPKHIHTMEELGFSAGKGVSPVAVSDPFPLFSEEAINIMRSEVLDPEVLEKYSYTSDIAPRQIRGYAPKYVYSHQLIWQQWLRNERYGKFIFEAWKHPATLAIISKIAGVDLVPVMDYEIGHVNLSMLGDKEDHKVSDGGGAIVGWHRDSYPFVCVLMMSDTTGMVGGETAIRTGTGEIRKVRGPSMVRHHLSAKARHTL